MRVMISGGAPAKTLRKRRLQIALPIACGRDEWAASRFRNPAGGVKPGRVLDTERRELRRGDALVAIEPKVFDLVAFIIENRQRVVSRDDLIAEVWDGRIVSEAALARCISEARSAIGDDVEARRLIKTIQRKGIRFVGTVRQEQGPGDTPDGGHRSSRPDPRSLSPTSPPSPFSLSPT